ncbi:hypothetical protein ABZ702_10300 [Streptomyces cyaneofuscatus]|uniref:hypothetical protein n=1 Tax=Streptomyces cyaneofuscatus TaxID=66883 RepID=UPI0034076343
MSKEAVEAQQQLADAQKEKAELDELIGALEQQVLDGEEAEASKQLGEQWGLRRLVELRQERAAKRLKEAEAADLAHRMEAARKAATKELAALGAGVVLEKYRVLLAALDDFVSICGEREDAVRKHSQALRQVGDQRMLVKTGDSRVMVDVPGERFEFGQYEPGNMLARAAGAVMAARSVNHQVGRGGVGIVRPSGVHPVERLLAVEAGEDRAGLDVNWSSGQWAARVVAHASATAKAGEVA